MKEPRRKKTLPFKSSASQTWRPPGERAAGWRLPLRARHPNESLGQPQRRRLPGLSPTPYPRLAPPVPLRVRVGPVHGERRVAARHGELVPGLLVLLLPRGRGTERDRDRVWDPEGDRDRDGHRGRRRRRPGAPGTPRPPGPARSRISPERVRRRCPPPFEKGSTSERG